MFSPVFWHIFSFSCCLAVVVVFRPVLSDLKCFAIFSAVWQLPTTFTDFQFCCCFAELLVSEQVLSVFKRFGPSLVKNVFVWKKLCFGFWSWKLFPSCFQCALAVFGVFDRFLVFVLWDRICRFQAARFNWLKGSWKRFGQKNLFLSEKLCFDILSLKSFRNYFLFF